MRVRFTEKRYKEFLAFVPEGKETDPMTSDYQIRWRSAMRSYGKSGMTLMNGRNETEENGVQSRKSIGKSGSARHFAVKTKLLAAKLFNSFSQYGKSSVRCIVIAGGQCNNLISE